MNLSFLQSTCTKIGRIKWMNSAPRSKCRYAPTTAEHILNIATHGFFILPSIYGGIVLFQESHNSDQVYVAIVYGISLICIFTTSTLFHVTAFVNCDRKWYNFFHRGDRAMIYVFIAASYFPWLTLSPSLKTNEITFHYWWLVWFFAIVGILYQQFFHEKYKVLEIVFYVFSGLLPAIPIIKMVKLAGLEELKLGGLLYLLGIIFFKSDGKIPCAHAIWHIFVAFAAYVHFFAVYRYLYVSNEISLENEMANKGLNVAPYEKTG